MPIKYYFEIVNGVVKHKLEVFSAEPREVPAALREVTAQTFASVVEGSTANQDGTYTAPDPTPVRQISKYAFLTRFTTAEATALEMLAAFPADTLQAKQTAAGIRVWQQRLAEASYVDLDDAAVTTQLAALKPVLIAAGVWADMTVANARVAEILA